MSATSSIKTIMLHPINQQTGELDTDTNLLPVTTIDKVFDHIDGSEGAPISLSDILNDKAPLVGYVPNLKVGDADHADTADNSSLANQLNTKLSFIEKKPYLYRTTCASQEVGRNKYEEFIGATVFWNQLIKNGNFANTDHWARNNSDCSFSVVNNVGIITRTTVTTNLPAMNIAADDRIKSIKGHRYLITFEGQITIKNPTTEISDPHWNIRCYASANAYETPEASVNVWRRVNVIVIATSDNQDVFRYVGVTSSTAASIAADDTLQFRNFNVFDLTSISRSNIISETATVDAFRSRFPLDFYGYSNYTTISTKPTKHITTGFNQWDEQWEKGKYDNYGAPVAATDRIRSKNYIRLVKTGADAYHVHIGHYHDDIYMAIYFYDKNKQFLSRISSTGAGVTEKDIEVPPKAEYMRFNLNSSYGIYYRNDICINIKWDGERDGEYEPAAFNEYDINDGYGVELKGIFKTESNQIYADGDIYTSDGKIIRRYGIQDLGASEVTWVSGYGASGFYTSFFDNLIKTPNSEDEEANIICSKYICVSKNASSTTDKSIAVEATGTYAGHVIIRDSSFSDAGSLKTSLSGVYLVYELKSSITETITGFTNPMVVDNWGTEEFIVDSSLTSIPIGHNTKYQPDLKAKLEVAPASPDEDGLYLMERKNDQNSYTQFPSLPDTNGTYTLSGTVSGSGSTKSMSWISALGIPYITTAPSSANTSGRLIIVVLSSEPSTKYDGYLYIITGA